MVPVIETGPIEEKTAAMRKIGFYLPRKKGIRRA
jgi:hypothetical protein